MFSTYSSQKSAQPSRNGLGAALLLLSACVAFIAALLVGPTAPRAQEVADDEVAAYQPQFTDPPADLEQAFWRCDYDAARYGSDLHDGAYCYKVTEELKAKKFGGDFELLLAWWQQHREQEHAAIAAATAEYPEP